MCGLPSWAGLSPRKKKAAGSIGETYGRFHLSTDSAAENSIGVATDGEVEDYRFSITARAALHISDSLKIASDLNGDPTLGDGDAFSCVTAISDVNGDGIYGHRGGCDSG